MPTQDQVAGSPPVASHETLPAHVCACLDALPTDTHPMSQLSAGIVALQYDSIFARKYRDGMPKTDYWEATLDDAMVLLGRLPTLAAYIYRRSYKDGEHLGPAGADLDWAANTAHMLGNPGHEFSELLRLYLTALADHEGGNVSAHATHLVGSALSDPYLCLASGINGLAGPLHGLASQEVMRWIVGVKAELGGGVPTKEQLTEFVWNTLNGGRVIPGYGHGVLRATDPRYMAQQRFAEEHLPHDENFKIVRMLYDVVPAILTEQGKAKNPVAQRRRPHRLPVRALRLGGVRLLHRAVRSLPGDRCAGFAGLGSGAGVAPRAAEERHDRVAPFPGPLTLSVSRSASGSRDLTSPA